MAAPRSAAAGRGGAAAVGQGVAAPAAAAGGGGVAAAGEGVAW